MLRVATRAIKPIAMQTKVMQASTVSLSNMSLREFSKFTYKSPDKPANAWQALVDGIMNK